MKSPDQEFDRALSKIERIRKEQGDQRRDAWDKIQWQAPEVANFLMSVKEAFGKPAAVLVKIGDDVVLEKGDILPAKYDRLKR